MGKAIYAASFKPADSYFPLVWDMSIRYVHAANVTDRYTSLYRAQLAATPADGSHVDLRVMVFKDKNHAEASATAWQPTSTCLPATSRFSGDEARAPRKT